MYEITTQQHSAVSPQPPVKQKCWRLAHMLGTTITLECVRIAVLTKRTWNVTSQKPDHARTCPSQTCLPEGTQPKQKKVIGLKSAGLVWWANA